MKISLISVLFFMFNASAEIKTISCVNPPDPCPAIYSPVKCDYEGVEFSGSNECVANAVLFAQICEMSQQSRVDIDLEKISCKK